MEHKGLRLVEGPYTAAPAKKSERKIPVYSRQERLKQTHPKPVREIPVYICAEPGKERELVQGRGAAGVSRARDIPVHIYSKHGGETVTVSSSSPPLSSSSPLLSALPSCAAPASSSPGLSSPASPSCGWEKRGQRKNKQRREIPVHIYTKSDRDTSPARILSPPSGYREGSEAAERSQQVARPLTSQHEERSSVGDSEPRKDDLPHSLPVGDLPFSVGRQPFDFSGQEWPVPARSFHVRDRDAAARPQEERGTSLHVREDPAMSEQEQAVPKLVMQERNLLPPGYMREEQKSSEYVVCEEQKFSRRETSLVSYSRDGGKISERVCEDVSVVEETPVYSRQERSKQAYRRQEREGRRARREARQRREQGELGVDTDKHSTGSSLFQEAVGPADLAEDRHETGGRADSSGHIEIGNVKERGGEFTKQMDAPLSEIPDAVSLRDIDVGSELSVPPKEPEPPGVRVVSKEKYARLDFFDPVLPSGADRAGGRGHAKQSSSDRRGRTSSGDKKDIPETALTESQKISHGSDPSVKESELLGTCIVSKEKYARLDFFDPVTPTRAELGDLRGQSNLPSFDKRGKKSKSAKEVAYPSSKHNQDADSMPHPPDQDSEMLAKCVVSKEKYARFDFFDPVSISRPENPDAKRTASHTAQEKRPAKPHSSAGATPPHSSHLPEIEQQTKSESSESSKTKSSLQYRNGASEYQSPERKSKLQSPAREKTHVSRLPVFDYRAASQSPPRERGVAPVKSRGTASPPTRSLDRPLKHPEKLQGLQGRPSKSHDRLLSSQGKQRSQERLLWSQERPSSLEKRSGSQEKFDSPYPSHAKPSNLRPPAQRSVNSAVRDRSSTKSPVPRKIGEYKSRSLEKPSRKELSSPVKQKSSSRPASYESKASNQTQIFEVKMVEREEDENRRMGKTGGKRQRREKNSSFELDEDAISKMKESRSLDQMPDSSRHSRIDPSCEKEAEKLNKSDEMIEASKQDDIKSSSAQIMNSERASRLTKQVSGDYRLSPEAGDTVTLCGKGDVKTSTETAANDVKRDVQNAPHSATAATQGGLEINNIAMNQRASELEDNEPSNAELSLPPDSDAILPAVAPTKLESSPAGNKAAVRRGSQLTATPETVPLLSDAGSDRPTQDIPSKETTTRMESGASQISRQIATSLGNLTRLLTGDSASQGPLTSDLPEDSARRSAVYRSLDRLPTKELTIFDPRSKPEGVDPRPPATSKSVERVPVSESLPESPAKSSSLTSSPAQPQRRLSKPAGGVRVKDVVAKQSAPSAEDLRSLSSFKEICQSVASLLHIDDDQAAAMLTGSLSQRKDLVEGLDSDAILDYLIQHGVLDPASLGGISDRSRPSSQRNSALLKHVEGHGTTAVALFINALRQSGQLHLASSLDTEKRIKPASGNGYLGKTRVKGQVTINLVIRSLKILAPLEPSSDCTVNLALLNSPTKPTPDPPPLTIEDDDDDIIKPRSCWCFCLSRRSREQKRREKQQRMVEKQMKSKREKSAERKDQKESGEASGKKNRKDRNKKPHRRKASERSKSVADPSNVNGKSAESPTRPRRNKSAGVDGAGWPRGEEETALSGDSRRNSNGVRRESDADAGEHRNSANGNARPRGRQARKNNKENSDPIIMEYSNELELIKLKSLQASDDPADQTCRQPTGGFVEQWKQSGWHFDQKAAAFLRRFDQDLETAVIKYFEQERGTLVMSLTCAGRSMQAANICMTLRQVEQLRDDYRSGLLLQKLELLVYNHVSLRQLDIRGAELVAVIDESQFQEAIAELS